jgi:hypothetical protein
MFTPVELLAGLEPAPSDYKTDMLPLTPKKPKIKLAVKVGLEPTPY